MIKLPFETRKKDLEIELDFNEKELRRIPSEDFLIVVNDINPILKEELKSRLIKIFKGGNESIQQQGLDVEAVYFLPEMTNRYYDLRNGKMFRSINKEILSIGKPIVPIRVCYEDPGFGVPLRIKKLVSDEPVRLKIRIGKPIDTNKQISFSSVSRFSRYLQSKILALGVLTEQKSMFPNAFKRNTTELPIGKPVDPELILKEIDNLTFDNLIASQGEFDVIVAASHQIPNTLLEIGRLREIAFRAVSEGTGKARDLDEFDVHYYQLIIWDKKAKKIAGGYRMAPGNQILNRFGKTGFYINSLFKIKSDFLPIMKESVELGRSYIAPEYQRKRLPLFLLWKGIIFYLIKNPQYRYLYGPMSISKDYSNLSKSLIVAFIRRYFFNEQLASYLQPRKPFKAKVPKVDLELLMDGLGNEIKFLDSIIEELEPKHFKVPILLRQYVKLNAKFISFNVDPAFSNVLDGFIILDLNDVPLSMIEALKKEA
jgi:putative hemolysin